MSSFPTNATKDVHARQLLDQLEKTIEETIEDVSSAKDVKKTINHLMNRFPLDQQSEQKLQDLLLRKNTAPSHRFCDIRDELAEIDRILAQRDAKVYQDDFQTLSEREQIIIHEADKHPLVKRLRVSYEFSLRPLKHDPRICLFLAIFPGNAILRKRFLIYWWIGEGLVRDEEEGERVFEELLDLELLIPHHTDQCPRVSKCKIFPWIRYMLISEAKKEKLLNLEGGTPRFDPTHSRRTCLIADPTNLSGKSKPRLDKTVRTIFNVNERDLDFQQQELAELERLAVLQLGRWQALLTHHIEVRDESFLTGLKTQKLLKHLSLRGISRITKLPESIRELVSLKILDLKACHNLETLPDAVASLEKLTHLDVSECYLLESLPKGLHNLTSLQVLKGFIIGSSQKSLIRLQHLPSLKNLKRLSIHVGSEATIQEGEFDNLKHLTQLRHLKISWGKADDVEISLSFPARLQKLDLEGIPYKTKPEWLTPSKLTNLDMLYIKGGKLRDLLDYEGERWNVKYLVLNYTRMPQINQETLRSKFPLLQYVKKLEWRDRKQSVEHEWSSDRFELRSKQFPLPNYEIIRRGMICSSLISG
ncbi:disease resistance RPP13-like protein 4 [Neltuma alba]|uniref:disease resistance RPP13-like protein 4 n=1 Tax=Neltuma alba TaxID=207710 RepID=UPI0010A583F3|nr:disease resistance RPP13-like protein 4 [Prosopis alba]